MQCVHAAVHACSGRRGKREREREAASLVAQRTSGACGSGTRCRGRNQAAWRCGLRACRGGRADEVKRRCLQPRQSSSGTRAPRPGAEAEAQPRRLAVRPRRLGGTGPGEVVAQWRMTRKAGERSLAEPMA